MLDDSISLVAFVSLSEVASIRLIVFIVVVVFPLLAILVIFEVLIVSKVFSFFVSAECILAGSIHSIILVFVALITIVVTFFIFT